MKNINFWKHLSVSGTTQNPDDVKLTLYSGFTTGFSPFASFIDCNIDMRCQDTKKKFPFYVLYYGCDYSNITLNYPVLVQSSKVNNIKPGQ